MSFEKSLKRLEEIVDTMENGNLSLEESIKLYEEGSKLSLQCKKELDSALLKVSTINE